jgi:hypothetical protein
VELISIGVRTLEVLNFSIEIQFFSVFNISSPIVVEKEDIGN